MSKQVDLILDSLKNRPEEWRKSWHYVFLSSNHFTIYNYGYLPTVSLLVAVSKDPLRKGYYKRIFLSDQSIWVLERAVSEWLENKK